MVEQVEEKKPEATEQFLQSNLLGPSYSEQAREQIFLVQSVNDPSLRREILMEVPSECL